MEPGHERRQRGRVRALSVRGNAKSNRHRKTHSVEPDGTGRKHMFLLGATWSVRASQESAAARVAMSRAERQEERRAEESRADPTRHPL